MFICIFYIRNISNFTHLIRYIIKCY